MMQAGVARGKSPVTGAARRIAVAAVSAVLITGCGGSSPSAPTPTPTPTPAPVRSLVTQGSSSGLLANYVHHTVFTTLSTGHIDVSVDWTYSTDTVRVVVASGSFTCYDGTYIDYNRCSIVADVNDGTKPRKIALPGKPAGTYTLYIDNFGPQTEAISWQVFLTTPG